MTMNGVRVERLSMRRPLVRDIRGAHQAAGAGALESEIELHLFAHLTGQTVEALEAMDLAIDYAQLQQAYRDFAFRASTSKARES